MPQKVKRIRDGLTRRALLSGLTVLLAVDVAQARRIRFPSLRRLGRGQGDGSPLTREEYEACRELQFQIAQTEPNIVRVRQDLKTSQFRLDDLTRQSGSSEAVLKHLYQTDRKSIAAALAAQEAEHTRLRGMNRELTARRESLQARFEETCAGRTHLPPDND